MKIYTKNGDSGETSLFGGKRVRKDDLRIECYGTIDELNAVIGIAAAETTSAQIKKILTKIQNYLFDAGSDLAAPRVTDKNFSAIPRIDNSYTNEIESIIDELEKRLASLKSFILPGGSKCAAQLHFARTVCRRAERRISKLSETDDLGNDILKFVNRLSDLLFVIARYANKIDYQPDIFWQKKK